MELQNSWRIFGVGRIRIAPWGSNNTPSCSLLQLQRFASGILPRGLLAIVEAPGSSRYLPLKQGSQGCR